MKLSTLAVTAATILLAAQPALAQQASEAWRASGFVMPESASYDPGTSALYVSNINSADMSPNGQGYITQVGLDGKVLKEKFAEGLNAPKGTYVKDGILYVAGVEEVVEIDLSTGELKTRHAIPGATFANDVAVADDGTIYVTETIQNAVYTIRDDKAEQFVADPALPGANGIVIDGDRLLIAALGDLSQGFENVKPSNVKAIDIASKAITDYGASASIGMLDGIELADGGVIVTDNGAGKVLKVASDGTVTELAAVGAGAADLEYIADQGLVIVPLLNSGEVVAYKLAP